MAADMDIDMDLDIGLTDEETTAPQIDIMPEVEAAVSFLQSFSPKCVAQADLVLPTAKCSGS